MNTDRRELLAMIAAAGVVRPAYAAAAAPVDSTPVAPYRAACVQTRILHTHARDGTFLPDNLQRNVAKVAETIDRASTETGAKLLVFSEFCFQLQQGPLTARQWEAGAIRVPGPEIAKIAAAAQRARVYVMVNPIERIDAFPGRYFLSGVLIGPNGDILHNYRKLYDLTNKTRPSDILDLWLDKFGAASLFPVADTPIGRLATTIGADLAWPEMVRNLVFNGAELVGNLYGTPLKAPSFVSERGPGAADEHDISIPTMVRRVRAYENMVFMLPANMGPLGADENAPLAAMQPSEIVDYRGNLLATSPDSAARFVTATIDIEALRKARCTPGPANPLAQLQAELHAPGYAAAHFARLNRFAAHPLDTGSEHDPAQREDIDSLIRRGILKAPARPAP